MFSTDIDLKSLLPHVIDAYSHVYGEEYRPMITERLNRALLLYYVEPKNIKEYVDYLKRCKIRELSIRFLEQIGEDTSKFRKDNFAKSFDIDTQEKLMNLFGDYLGFSPDADIFSPLRAFDPNNKARKAWRISNALTIINYLRGEDKEKIDADNLEAFMDTDESKELMKTIFKYIKIYDALREEYNEWKKNLSDLESYVEDERKRKEFIFLKKKEKLYRKVYNFLPGAIREALNKLPLIEQINLILGENDLGSDSNIEIFLKKNMKMDTSFSSKIFYYVNIGHQIVFLRALGVKLPKVLKNVTAELAFRKNGLSQEVVNAYFEFIKQDDVKKYIPTSSLITSVIKARKRMYEEALEEYYETRDDFIEIMNHFSNNPYNREMNYDMVKGNHVCIVSDGGYDAKGDFVAIMFYCMRDAGLFAHDFIHECGHVIDQNKNGDDGLETGHLNTENPYDKDRRSYEVFNEIVNDIFTMEANKYLQDQGIFLIEPKEFTDLDPSSFNTNTIVKDLVMPLVIKFRAQMIKAKVTSTPSILTDLIGTNNLDELVDAINKVDHLIHNGLEATLKYDRSHPMIEEYYNQVKRVEKIYQNIIEYYIANYSNTSSEDTNKTI